MALISTLAIGFSVISSMILLVCYSLLYRRWNKSWTSIASASVLLIAFLLIQLAHLIHIDNPSELFASKVYSSLIILTAPAFYLFITEYVVLDYQPRWTDLLHLSPLFINLFIDNQWSIPLGFLLGAGYAAVSLIRVYQLRDQRQRFHYEAFAILFFLLAAAAIGLLAALAVFIHPSAFITGYTILIGLSYVLVVTSLLLYPDIATNLHAAAETRYAKTTLEKVDRTTKLDELQDLMKREKRHRDETLNLAAVSSELSLTSHQLSELINAEYGYGFSHFIRRCRIEDAQQQLLAEPGASILSISLAAGFTSQSTFYAAFHDICGETPGAYRKRLAQ